MSASQSIPDLLLVNVFVSSKNFHPDITATNHFKIDPMKLENLIDEALIRTQNL
jgi:hypothetical protein